jgi:hypothetical protein
LPRRSTSRAQLGIADIIAIAGPRSPGDLAERADADPDALFRVLRALASIGVFAERADGTFALTPLAEALRSDVPGSLRDFAIMTGGGGVWRSWGEVLHTVRTGEPAFEHVFGMPVFDYYAAHPGCGTGGCRRPQCAQRRGERRDRRCLRLQHRRLRHGGWRWRRQPAAHDPRRPSAAAGCVVRDAPRCRPGPGSARRRSEGRPVRAGDGRLLHSDSRTRSLLLLKKVIHDWPGERAAALPAGGRLLLVENVIRPGNEPLFGKGLDLLMLVYAGGRERTADEFHDLLATAGFAMKQVTTTAANVSVIEAVAL